ncbi:MAG: hypothetical protein AB7K52_02175 [Phycisphaerales bacterium]
MGRLRSEFIERIESFGHRVVDVADALGAEGHSPRIVRQVMGSGTSAGANFAEADEALHPLLLESSELRTFLGTMIKISREPAKQL